MSNGRFVILLLFALSTLALVAQVLIDFSTVNLASTCMVYASSVVLLLYLLWTPSIYTHPVSTYAILGFCVTTQMGALLGQTAFGTSLALNLRQPLGTFSTLAVAQVLALVAHTGYRYLLNPANSTGPGLWGVPRLFLNKLGLYQAPGTGALWLMGYVGLFSFLIGNGRDGVVFKVFEGIGFLTWAPYLIPMYLLLQGPSYCNPRRQYPHLLFFMGLVVLLGLAANARVIILSGFVTIGLFAFLLVIRSQTRVRVAQVFKIAFVAAALAVMAIPVSDLATAMVVARKARGFVSAPQMVQETFRYATQPEALEAEKNRQRLATSSQYDEFYFENPLVARLVETKFHDNALYFASTLTNSDVDLLIETSLKMMAVLLPQPLINILGWRIDKQELEFSMGDYLSHLSTGSALGGYRTGSMLGHSVAVFGVGWMLFYFVGCLVAFAMLDLLSYRTANGQVVLTAVVMLGLWKIFQNGLAAESMHNWFGYFVRTLPQNTVIFLAFAFLARVPGLLRGGNKRRPAPTQPLPG